jgi:hypothetical protein
MEKLPMEGGNYTRVVVAPTIRQLNSTIGNQSYVKFYLPLLTTDTNPLLSQSVPLIGKTVTQYTNDYVEQVCFRMEFTQSDEGVMRVSSHLTTSYKPHTMKRG